MCSGDSGGPLAAMVNKKWTLAGMEYINEMDNSVHEMDMKWNLLGMKLA